VKVHLVHLGPIAPTSFNFELSQISPAVNCTAPKRFKHWSPFNSELPSDHRSNFDLGSTRGYACALGNECSLGYYCCKKIVRFESYPAQKTSSYRIIRPLMQLYWWYGYVKFLLYSFYVLFVLDKLTNKWINRIFRWWCLAATVNIRSNPNHTNKNSFVSIYKTSNSIMLHLCYIGFLRRFYWINS